MSATPAHQFVERLLKAVEDRDFSVLDALLADEVVFHTPRFLKPITNRQHMLMILRSIPVVIEGFHYERRWVSGDEAIMEFKGRIGEIVVHGLDIFTIRADGRIHELTVFIRPTKGLQALGEAEDRLAHLFMPPPAGQGAAASAPAAPAAAPAPAAVLALSPLQQDLVAGLERALAKGPLNGILRINFDDGSAVVVDGRGTPARLDWNSTEQGACQMTASTATFVELLGGKLDPTMAFMGGKLRITGDMGVAMTLASRLR